MSVCVPLQANYHKAHREVRQEVADLMRRPFAGVVVEFVFAWPCGRGACSMTQLAAPFFSSEMDAEVEG